MLRVGEFGVERLIPGSLQLVFACGGYSGFFPGTEVEVVSPKELYGVAVVDAQRVRSVVVVDAITVVKKPAVRFLFFPDVVL